MNGMEHSRNIHRILESTRGIFKEHWWNIGYVPFGRYSNVAMEIHCALCVVVNHRTQWAMASSSQAVALPAKGDPWIKEVVL